MKRLILIVLLMVSNVLLGQENIPQHIKEEIRRSELSSFDSGDGDSRRDYYEMQKDAYLLMEKRLKDEKLTEGERTAIRGRLKSMYGSNYALQIKSLEDEIIFVTILNKAQKEEKIVKERNIESKEELKVILEEAETAVPKKYMEHFKSEAERLYPNNSYEQKRYIESSINTYKKFN